MGKAHRELLPAAWALAGGFALLSRLSPGFSSGWQRRVALPAGMALHRLTARVPFPLLEPLAVALGIVTLLSLAAGRPRAALWALLVAVAGYALLWYPAYWAAPVEPVPAPEPEQLAWLCGERCHACN